MKKKKEKIKSFGTVCFTAFYLFEGNVHEVDFRLHERGITKERIIEFALGQEEDVRLDLAARQAAETGQELLTTANFISADITGVFNNSALGEGERIVYRQISGGALYFSTEIN